MYIYIMYISIYVYRIVTVDALYPGPISCGKSLALPTNRPTWPDQDPDGPKRALFEGPTTTKPPGCAGRSNEIESEHATKRLKQQT